MQELQQKTILPGMVLDSMNAGVYVTDLDRRILYWNDAARQITGWQSDRILGKCCHEQVLCHVDKDGRPLCGEEFCPLHRAITTGTSSVVPIIVYALKADGTRVPMRVSVGPLRDAAGNIVGGVETFQDLSGEVADAVRAQKIQSQALINEAADDPRISARIHYTPHDLVGGDFCAISRIAADRYAFILADVMGHGIAAALYTMYLRSLWEEHLTQDSPAAILSAMNRRLGGIMSGSVAFATAVCGTLDLATGQMCLASAGGPEPLIFQADGDHVFVGISGMPMGLTTEEEYEQEERQLREGDRVLLFTDGFLEVSDRDSKLLGAEGLLRMLKDENYPSRELVFSKLERRLLSYSNSIRFDDDLTLVELSCGQFGRISNLADL